MMYLVGSLSIRVSSFDNLQEIAECLQQNAKSEKATAFLIWKALLFSVVALTTISEHLHHRIYFTVANILQSPVFAIVQQTRSHRCLN